MKTGSHSEGNLTSKTLVERLRAYTTTDATGLKRQIVDDFIEDFVSVFMMIDEAIDRQSSTKSASECGACDKPGEHCANVHGICSRHGGRPHETSAQCPKCGAALEPYVGCPKCNLPPYP